MDKKGQIAVEYVILVGIVTALSIAMLVISMYYSKHVGTVVETSQVDRLGRQVVDTAETVFFLWRSKQINHKNLHAEPCFINYSSSK